MRLLLVVLSVALTTLISAPARAQSAADDQYGSSGVGQDAATDALEAHTAFSDAHDDNAAVSEEGAAHGDENESGSSGPAFASAGKNAWTKTAASQKGASSQEGAGGAGPQEGADSQEEADPQESASASTGESAWTKTAAPQEGASSQERAGGAGPQEGPGSEARVASEEGDAIDSLPETGGISPLSLGVLLFAGGVLIGTLTRWAFALGD
jgi:hypothetical protein